MRILSYTVSKSEGNRCVRDYLRKNLGLSDKLITDLKKGPFMFVNDENVTVRYELKTNDVLKLCIPEIEKSSIIPTDGDLDIIYEDEDFLAINKPYNMPTHPSKYHIDDTLANIVCAYMGEDFVFRSANRLDKDTTGVVIVAKNRFSADYINRCIRSKEIKKEYVAICEGVCDGEAIIEKPIKKESERGIKRIVSDNGQYAKTELIPLKAIENKTLVRLIPHTGRTHQLRVHMSHIGHPLYGDYLYGTEIKSTRTMLHCEKICFIHPVTSEYISLYAPIPDDFLEITEK